MEAAYSRKTEAAHVAEAPSWSRQRHGGNNRSDAHGQHLPWAASQVEPLLEETLPEGSEAEDSEAEGSGTALGRVGADRAYDTFDVYDVISDHGATPVIPPQKNAKIKKHGNSSGPPLPRDEAIR